MTCANCVAREGKRYCWVPLRCGDDDLGFKKGSGVLVMTTMREEGVTTSGVALVGSSARPMEAFAASKIMAANRARSGRMYLISNSYPKVKMWVTKKVHFPEKKFPRRGGRTFGLSDLCKGYTIITENGFQSKRCVFNPQASDELYPARFHRFCVQSTTRV